MKKVILILAIYAMTVTLHAQSVGMSDVLFTPDASSMLEVRHPNKGILITRVALTSTSDATTIASPATSLLVYNTATAGTGATAVSPGYFYNAGTPAAPNWRRLLAGGSAGDGWLTTGNFGTTPVSNWLGTNDAQDFVIRTNNAERMRITSAGNVGIGTTTPQFLTHLRAVGTTNTTILNLHLAGNTANQSAKIRFSNTTSSSIVDLNERSSYIEGILVDPGLGSQALAFGTSSFFGDGAIERMRIDQWGNVGIGDETPLALLTVGFNDLFRVESTGHTRTINATAASPAYSFTASTNTGMWSPGVGAISFSTVGSDRMRIDPSGNIGIGTTTPTHRFHVDGSVRFVNLAAPAGETTALVIDGIGIVKARPLSAVAFAGETDPTAWRLTGNAGTSPASNFVGTSDAQDFVMRTNNTERMRILSGGNVGIGTTAPSEQLDVLNNIRAGGIVYWGILGSRSEIRNDAGLSGTTARSGFFETSTPTPAANWPTGATSWWHLLDIRHSSTSNNYAMQFAGSFFDQNLFFRKTNNNAAQPWVRVLTTADGEAWRLIGNAASATDFIGTTNAIDFRMFTNNAERIRITSGGNVGIGTTTPTHRFHVTGPVRFESLPAGTQTTALLIDVNGIVSTRTLQSIAFTGTETDPTAWRLTGNAASATDFIGTTNAIDFRMFTNSLERMRITSAGNVGIGISPSQRFHVHDPVVHGASTTFGAGAAAIIRNENSELAMGLNNAAPWTYWIQARTSINTARDLSLQPSGGNIGIGTLNPTYRLHVIGRFKSDGINETSDARLKKNIEPLQNSLNKILAMQGVTYEWNKDGMEDRVQIGLISQEVEKILPEIVHTDTEGYKSIQYSVLVAVLIEGIKEQQAEIEAMKIQQAEYEKLLQKIKQMEEDLATINAMLGTGGRTISVAR